MKNRINSIVLSDFSEYVEGKHLNGGCYGYEERYTYSPDMDCFVLEWFTTSELIPDGVLQSTATLEDVIFEMIEFIRNNADNSNCTIYINGTTVWTSTPSEKTDVDTSNYFLDE